MGTPAPKPSDGICTLTDLQRIRKLREEVAQLKLRELQLEKIIKKLEQRLGGTNACT
jgi:hypothetical protein